MDGSKDGRTTVLLKKDDYAVLRTAKAHFLGLGIDLSNSQLLRLALNEMTVEHVSTEAVQKILDTDGRKSPSSRKAN